MCVAIVLKSPTANGGKFDNSSCVLILTSERATSCEMQLLGTAQVSECSNMWNMPYVAQNRPC